ncbi:hypothetical protein A3F34_00265 [Candidatus Roizmanbacteria bacterium RIFCSPHIGHO2_12_FULL_44_10]|uniref:Uncharacterized protein n=1 Tax=Candidatus Roizmanbacteria bacterium RIFCSPHIGHO2_12_FULL_44_10 TaxID=1802054 RepID=A0A1F7I6K5_9BACT|nr:MAG: hypothetical protein A3F34_00265 [Candidatus Roizmanbacteria bacterium RIFCSPHIGHO2_12_FULL_44_10]
MDFPIKKIVLGFAGFMIVLNLLVLDIEILQNSSNPTIQKITQKTPPTATLMPETELAESSQTTAASCPTACLDIIKQATASSKITTTAKTNATTTGVKEFFIPIGSGSTSLSDWEDVNGLQVYVDASQYSAIKSAVFEASVRVPTKNQWIDVRLYNVTDKHAVWFSEVRFPSGSDPTLIRSAPMVLDSGSKLLKVQMRTQLGHIAYLDQSRIVITMY